MCVNMVSPTATTSSKSKCDGYALLLHCIDDSDPDFALADTEYTY